MREPPRGPLPSAPSCDCDADPIAGLEHLFVQKVQMSRIQRGQDPARRPVFLRLHGVAHGRFEIAPDLPEELCVGLFGQAPSYPAWVRFSSDQVDGRPDLRSTVGIGIKLFGVQGEKLLPPDEGAPTADFLLQNMDVFFVNDAHEMCAFTKASLTSKADADAWLRDHPDTQRILDEMEKVVPTVLGTDLWSVIPFRFGEQRYCKYKLEPELVPGCPETDSPDYDDPNYLGVDLGARLHAGEARLRFLVQLRTDPDAMPLDHATTRWCERASPPVHVATLVLPAQDIAARGQAEYGETLAFNPWRVPREHEPVGTIADARKVVYRASAEVRRNVNGEPLGEPRVPRPATEYPPARDTRIVRAAIHPGIGVARVGDSTRDDGYTIGPEVTEPSLTLTGATRDCEGAIKRQAARFRVYGYNAAGEIVGEIDAGEANVRWTVELANKKASWYQFQAAMDIPEAKELTVPRRNPALSGADRASLAITPRPRAIEGARKSGPEYVFDDGTFLGVPVPVGEVRTDEAGRLLVLGGHGKSASPAGEPVFDPKNPDSFNNADGWYDDISDGPVTAEVTIAGRAIPVEPAWVTVAPPNYAPDVIAWRTIYDLLYDAYVTCGWLPFPEQVSFTRDVFPAVRRLSNLQWVNKGFATMFGKGGPMDFEDPELIAKLAHRPPTKDDPDPYAELRQVILNAFRPADTKVAESRTWPWIYGDAFGSFSTAAPDNDLPLSSVRNELLARWAAGDFVDDWDPDAEPPRTLEEVPLQEQPAMLDQAALHFCLADAFHPGCEITWPMRHTTLYSAPFRIRHRPAGEPEPDYGTRLDQESVLAPDGPLYAQGPGDITRWMALPWQGDTAFCRSGYEPDYDPYLPTFWPARVPNQVLTTKDYEIVVDASRSREERIAAFNRRPQWLRKLTGSTSEQMIEMVKHFGSMGIVEARQGVEGDPDFPAVMLVESLPEEELEHLSSRALERLTRAAHTEPERRLRQAGWESEEQYREFRKLMQW